MSTDLVKPALSLTNELPGNPVSDIQELLSDITITNPITSTDLVKPVLSLANDLPGNLVSDIKELLSNGTITDPTELNAIKTFLDAAKIVSLLPQYKNSRGLEPHHDVRFTDPTILENYANFSERLFINYEAITPWDISVVEYLNSGRGSK